MKLLIKSIAPLAAALAVPFSVNATVETDPVGYKNVVVRGDGGLNLIGIEFLEPAVFSGPVSGVGTNTVIADTSFDTILEGSQSYFLDIVESPSPEKVGVNTTVVAWSGNELTIGDDLDGFLTPSSDRISIHRLPTIAEVFGDGGDVLEGGSSTQADLVLIPNPDGSGLNRYYYSTGGFTGVGWRQVGASGDKGNTPIYFSDGIYIFKRSSGDAELTFSGSVKTTGSNVAVEEGFTPFSTIFPSGTTLGNSGLFDADNPSNSLASGSATTADLVLVDSDGDGSLERYYYSSGGFTGTGWRQVGSSGDKSNVELASGFAIFKRSGSVSLERTPSY